MNRIQYYIVTVMSLTFLISAVLVEGEAATAQNLLKGAVLEDAAQVQADRQDSLAPEQPPLRLSRQAVLKEHSTEEIPPVAPERPSVSRPSALLQQETGQTPITAPVTTSEFSNGIAGVLADHDTGRILQIYPGSDAMGRLRVGDIEVAINGIKVPPHKFQEACIGPPGSVMKITVIRSGQYLTFPVRRTDWRIYSQQGLPSDYASPERIGLIRR